MSHHYLESPQTLFSGQGGRMEHRYLHMRQGVIFIEFRVLLFPLLPQTRFTILFQNLFDTRRWKAEKEARDLSTGINFSYTSPNSRRPL